MGRATNKLAENVLTLYLQSWPGIAPEKRLDALNRVIAYCTTDGPFVGVEPDFKAISPEQAALADEFVKSLQTVWCGNYEEEVANVKKLMEQFKEKVAKLKETAE